MKQLKILVVDDVYTNRLLLKEIITDAGHSSVQAENGKLAIEVLKDMDIDIVLMDIEMPIMNGIETTQYIRYNLPYPLNQIPIIALTAHNPQIFFEDYSSEGFNMLLTKPYSLDKIKQVIETVYV